MELQEQVTALNAEKKQLTSMIENINAEKIALDQMLVESIKASLAAKRDVLLKDNTINQLNTQLQGLLKEKEDMQNTINNLPSSE